MASIAMLIRGALANAVAFTSSSYLFSRLSKDSIDKEKKRHNRAASKGVGRMSPEMTKKRLTSSISNSDWKEKWKPTSKN